MRQKVLVTGTSGFLGKALCSSLHSRKDLFVMSVARTKSNIIADEHIIIENIVDCDWESLSVSPDVVIHLAGRAHILNEKSRSPISEFRKVNVDATLKLAKFAAAKGAKKFIYVSSIKVNGEERDYPYSVNDEPHPQEPYGLSKLEAEKALEHIARETEMEVIIIRPPLVYGPEVKANFYQLVRIVDKKWPLPLKNISNHRSFIYLENLIDFIAFCIDRSYGQFQTFLVSDHEVVSTPELINIIGDALSINVKLFKLPSFIFNIADLLFKDKIRRLTGSLYLTPNCLEWSPPYSMKEGISNTIRWYQNQAKSDAREKI